MPCRRSSSTTASAASGSFVSMAKPIPSGSAATASAKVGTGSPLRRSRARRSPLAVAHETGQGRQRRAQEQRVVEHHRHAVAREADVDLHVVGAELRRAPDALEAVLGSVARRGAVGDDHRRHRRTLSPLAYQSVAMYFVSV